MKIITGGIGLLTLVAMTGCQRTSAPATAASITSTKVMAPDSASASRKLQPGDCLLVTFHRKSLPQPITERVIVDAAGNITLPLAGKVRVSGQCDGGKHNCHL